MTKKYLFAAFIFLTLSCSDYEGDISAPSSPLGPDQKTEVTSNPFPPGMENPNDKPFSEERMLVNIGVNVIYKAVKNFSLQSEILKNKADLYCSSLEEETIDSIPLSDFKDQWKTTMIAFHTLQAAPIGPLSDNQSKMSQDIYSWPFISACGIDERVAKFSEDKKITGDWLNNERGLGALEYLLFENTLTPKCNALFNKKAIEWGKKPLLAKKKDRCQYALLISQDVFTSAQKLESAWNPERANFTKSLVDGSRYKSIKDAVNAMTDALLTIESLKDDKLAKPLGIHEDCKSDAKVCPELAEHQWSGIALEAIQAELIGFKNIFFGSFNTTDKSHGFDDYLIKEGHTEIADQMKHALSAGISSAQNISTLGSLQQQITTFDSIQCGIAIHQTSGVTPATSPLCDFYQNVRQANQLLREDVLIILALTSPPGFQGDND